MGQAIAESAAAGTELAVCYLDLDGFKPVNDRFGHETGDRLLVEVVHRLQPLLGPRDTLARLGGDEFVVLLGGLRPNQADCRLVEPLLSAIAQPFTVEGTGVALSASVGVTIYPQDEGDADTLLRHADQAMYRAKEDGKNRCHFFDPRQDRELRARRATIRRVEQAFAAGELIFHYQPIVDLDDRRVVGAEALVRWRHPERGLLPPAELLDAVLGTELEIALGELALRSALAQMADWKRQGLRLRVSVNIGAGHLQQVDFAPRLGSILAEHPGASGEDLGLEILESAAIGDLEHASRTLAACRKLGVTASLDDFGTGYSSLACFRRLPLAALKIDVSFVQGMLDDAEDSRIVASVIALAHAFERTVVAEGVETPAHGAALLKLGCRLAQGFGIARPMAPEDLPGWVRTWAES
jgi:diguanylate cyclase (GGDEF)-like protein